MGWQIALCLLASGALVFFLHPIYWRGRAWWFANKDRLSLQTHILIRVGVHPEQDVQLMLWRYLRPTQTVQLPDQSRVRIWHEIWMDGKRPLLVVQDQKGQQHFLAPASEIRLGSCMIGWNSTKESDVDVRE